MFGIIILITLLFGISAGSIGTATLAIVTREKKMPVWGLVGFGLIIMIIASLTCFLPSQIIVARAALDYGLEMRLQNP